MVQGRPGDKHVSTKIVSGYVVRLKTLFGWAIKRGRLPEGASNPFTEQHRKVGKKAPAPPAGCRSRSTN
jgi:hypothetical protein